MYPAKMITSTMPSHRSMRYLVKEKSQMNNIDATITARSTMVIPVMAIGVMSPVMPRIIRMLNTFDPSTLPMAMPLLPL